MASKKCPKCGEDNPAEAVMCWACYTPLSGGGAVGMAGAAGISGLSASTPLAQAPVGVPPAEESVAKKDLDPKVIGVVAFVLIVGVVGFLVKSGMSPDTDIKTAEAPPDKPDDPNVTTPPVNPAPALSVAPSLASSPPPAPVPVAFSMVTSPNPKYETGTLGILVPPSAAAKAAGTATFVRDQFARNGRWTRIQLCVFTDKTTAAAFSAYQGPRGGQPLSAADYQQLSTRGVWTNTPVFLESSGKKEVVHYPSRNPNGWWGR